jgi:thiamine biosynthesis lipoprotein
MMSLSGRSAEFDIHTGGQKVTDRTRFLFRKSAGRGGVCFVCLVLAFSFSACADNASISSPSAKVEFFAMNTLMSIEVRGAEAEAAVAAGRDEVYRLERLLSRTDPKSEVSAINTAAGSEWTEVSEETFSLIQTALLYSEETDGAFDITIAPVMDLWGFSSGEHRVPDDAEIGSVLERIGYEHLLLDETGIRVKLENPGMSMDLGAVAKGYAGDRVKEIIKQFDFETALINLGGNVTVIGRKPNGDLLRVAITDPENRQQYLGVLGSEDTHVITSGGYERFFEQDGKVYIHIMDPETARPAQSDLLSVSVIDSNGVRSDILSTALFVMGREEAIRYWSGHRDLGLVMAKVDGEVLVSKNLLGTFRVTEGKSVTYFDGE